MATNIYPYPVINLPVYHLLFLLWKIVKQVFYNNNLYILYNTDTFTMNKLMCTVFLLIDAPGANAFLK